MARFSGLTPFSEFKKALGVESITFLKGKGRQFASTQAGVLFMAAKFDKSKPAYVTMAGPDLVSSTGESLAGSFWLVNSVVKEGDTL